MDIAATQAEIASSTRRAVVLDLDILHDRRVLAMMDYIEAPSRFSRLQRNLRRVLTVLSCEQSSDRTICLSGQVVTYVRALTPLIETVSGYDQRKRAGYSS